MLSGIALHNLRLLRMNKFIYNALLAHPAEVNETYSQHLLAASRFALRLWLAAAACLIHALVPCFFTRKASDMLHNLHTDMYTNRAAKLDDQPLNIATTPTSN